MVSQKSTLLPLLAAVPYAAAWGSLGHSTVAFVAQNHVSAKTAKFAQKLFNDTSSAYLANVANWADSYRKEPGGEFSGVLHYIDAFDVVPTNCNVVYERDCPEEGCIVSAIANYSSRAVTPSVGLTEQQMALKWVIHFLGDIHQPLHVENIAVGGNNINVTFNGVKTNLHSIWDTAIPQKAYGNYTLETAHDLAASLTAEIKHGKFKKESKNWAKGINADKPIETSMLWANEANQYICTTVLPQGPDAVFDKELSGKYYETAIPVVTKQLARAGFRLAAWLDAIVEEAEKHGHGNGHGKDEKDHGNGHGKDNKDHGNGHGKDNKDHGKGGKWHDKRGSFKLEPWMEKAREARRAFGSDCGCTAEEHDH